MTLSWLKQLKNGDTVEIHYITTDLMDLNIPSQIKQDVPSPNFEEKAYFKKVKEVFVWYYSNTNGEPKKLRLDSLKEVCSAGLLANVTTGKNLLNDKLLLLFFNREDFRMSPIPRANSPCTILFHCLKEQITTFQSLWKIT